MVQIDFKGKQFIRNYHLAVKYHQLVPDEKKSLTDKISLHDNLIIHGDNLKALKALLPTYAGRIKCIYIDPPYNIGNEGWVYNDNVNSPMMQEWLGRVVDKEDLTRHDKWLCMMWPRLRLLRELLAEDGVIFISIDDIELANLRAIMEEIFPNESFVASIVWEKGKKGDVKQISINHEYVAVYVKNRSMHPVKWRQRKPGVDGVLEQYDIFRKEFNNEHSSIRNAMLAWYRSLPKGDSRKKHKHYNWSDERGLYFAADFAGPDDGRESRPRHDIFHPVTGKPCKKPSTGWRWDEEKTQRALADVPQRIHFGPDETTIPNRKSYLVEVSNEPFQSVIYKDGRAGTKELEQILKKGAFSFPKDSEVLAQLIALVTDKDSIILDSFAGSGTTAHAVLALNKEDGGDRKFILVEMEDYADKITAERVRRVITGVKGAKGEHLKKRLGRDI